MKIKYNSEENFKKALDGKSIILFPSTKQLNIVFEKYPYIKNKILFIWDNDKSKTGQTVTCDGITYNVRHYEEMALENNNVCILVCSWQQEILKQLRNNPYLNEVEVYLLPLRQTVGKTLNEAEYYNERVISARKHYYEIASRWLADSQSYLNEKMDNKNLGKMIIPIVQLVLTTKCSLNCKECFFMEPYCEDKRHYELELLKSEVDSLMEVIDECIGLELIGGEPLLHPYFSEILLYCLEQEKIGYIQISTNGTIIPNEKILEICKNPRVTFAVSEYPGVVDYHQVENILEKNRIKYICKHFKWKEMGAGGYNVEERKFYSYKYSTAELQDKFMRCGNSKWCHAILENKFFICYRTAMLWKQGYPIPEDEYVDLKGERESRRNKLQILYLKSYSEGCNYCGMADDFADVISPGEQMC